MAAIYESLFGGGATASSTAPTTQLPAAMEVQARETQPPPGKPNSFLNPTGATATKPPKAISPIMELVVFFAFVFVRAFHPVVIDASKRYDETKGKKDFLYQSSSTVIVMTVSMCIFCLFFCFAMGGKEQFRSVWEPKPFMVFSINGIIYALGDYLEMASISGLPAAAYQILQQSRIILTALLMIPAKGVYQTRLQWTLLTILMCSLSTYMVIASGKKDSGKSAGGNLFVGTMFAMAKVVISCVGAVISDKYMKLYKNDPTHVCIARTFVARAIAIVLLSFTQDIWTKGFFSGWDVMTIGVTMSFIIKSVSTLYIVALLDSILKNIAESFAVLVIYGYDIMAPWVDKQFDTATFLSVLVVVAACAAYVDSKGPIEKAAKYDKQQAALAASGQVP
jgi:hypothetical protein